MDSNETETTPEEPCEIQDCTTPDSSSDETRPSRRSFLQASGLAIGIGALGERSRHNQQRHGEVRPMRNASTSRSDQDPLRTTQQVTLSTGQKILDAMQAKAEELGVPSVLTVTDAEGNLIAQRRMNNAWLPSVSISENKAYTAAGFEMPTHNLADVTTPGESLWGLHVTDESRIVVFGGGYPLVADDNVVGAVGASGGQVSQDREIASAGVDEFERIVG